MRETVINAPPGNMHLPTYHPWSSVGSDATVAAAPEPTTDSAKQGRPVATRIRTGDDARRRRPPADSAVVARRSLAYGRYLARATAGATDRSDLETMR
uniref:Uncharacterized protein n=1 Tax=Plectus sambesii TaxID=2011161 RepID=A0A914V6G8_9BILA